VPALVLHDFGVGEELGNVVFADSGLFGGSGDLVEARFRRARPGWTDDNYFHPAQNNDWIEQLRRLLALRDAGLLPPRPASERGPGGALRLAWDRKRALGRFDRSWSVRCRASSSPSCAARGPGGRPPDRTALWITSTPLVPVGP
jgi:hypothetical protein